MSSPGTMVAREIIAEPPVVWNALADLRRWPRILTGVDSLEFLEGDGLAPGVRWHETRRLAGVSHVHDVEVVAVDEGRGATLEYEVEGAKIRVTYRVKPSSLGTRLEAELVGLDESGGLAKKIFGNLGAGLRAARNMVDQDLKDFTASVRT